MEATRSKRSIHPVCLHWPPFPLLSHAWLRPAWSIYHRARTWGGVGGVLVEIKQRETKPTLLFCLSNIQTSLTCQGNVSSEIPPQFCCQSCTAIQHQSDVSGSDDIILTVVMHYASNSISCEWLSFVFNEFSVYVCVRARAHIFILVKWIPLDSISNNSMFYCGCISVER